MSYNPANVGTPPLARAASNPEPNNSGGTLAKATPVRITSTGINTIDVSSEAEANAIAGIVRADISDLGTGEVVNNGKIEDITTSAAIGDVLYVDKSGGLTNIKPSVGVNSFVALDWVVRVGVVCKNASNPLLKDLLINLQIIGQL
jgi:hypothetical protein